MNELQAIRRYAAEAGGPIVEMAERAIQSGVMDMDGFRRYHE